jgi:UDP-N-acetylglucosamine 2-epimerase (non-hydrolysing)
MLDQALNAFGLEPDLDLNLMKPRQTLTELTGRILSALDRVMTRQKPNLVIVQGDTASAMVAALAAYYHKIPVAHLEAGLRTGDLYQPFPEEGNRRLISTLAEMHFAPTNWAAGQLHREGIPRKRILVTGNTVVDALLFARAKVSNEGGGTTTLKKPFVLITMHRRESYGGPFEEICRAIRLLVERNPGVNVAFPVHPSPSVREPIERLLSGHDRIQLSEPMGYLNFVQLLDACHFVLTDSGGIQEEAPALGKPVLVLRNKTERPEAVEAGTSQLVGTSCKGVLTAAEKLLHDEVAFRTMSCAKNPYGDGSAAERAVAAVRFHFGLTSERPTPFITGAHQRRGGPEVWPQ